MSQPDLFSEQMIGALRFAGGLRVRMVRKALTASQIKSFKTTPVQVLAAPGTNKAVVALCWMFDWTAGGTPMAAGGPVSLVDHGGHVNVAAGSVPAATITSASSVTHIGGQASSTGLARPANTAIDIEGATADFTTGDGTAIVYLLYVLLPTNA